MKFEFSYILFDGGHGSFGAPAACLAMREGNGEETRGRIWFDIILR